MKGSESSVYTVNVDGGSAVCIFAKMEVSFTVKYRCTHSSTDKNVKVSSEQSLARCDRSSEKIINACMKVIRIIYMCVYYVCNVVS